jgi:hypothetical protein
MVSRRIGSSAGTTMALAIAVVGLLGSGIWALYEHGRPRLGFDD